jgi:hypothetical protein
VRPASASEAPITRRKSRRPFSSLHGLCALGELALQELEEGRRLLQLLEAAPVARPALALQRLAQALGLAAQPLGAEARRSSVARRAAGARLQPVLPDELASLLQLVARRLPRGVEHLGLGRT